MYVITGATGFVVSMIKAFCSAKDVGSAKAGRVSVALLEARSLMEPVPTVNELVAT